MSKREDPVYAANYLRCVFHVLSKRGNLAVPGELRWALELAQARDAGYSWSEIADALGISRFALRRQLIRFRGHTHTTGAP